MLIPDVGWSPPINKRNFARKNGSERNRTIIVSITRLIKTERITSNVTSGFSQRKHGISSANLYTCVSLTSKKLSTKSQENSKGTLIKRVILYYVRVEAQWNGQFTICKLLSSNLSFANQNTNDSTTKKFLIIIVVNLNILFLHLCS